MAQFCFTQRLLQAAKEQGIHTCMETCGFVKLDKLKAISDYVDIFLYDYKETDSILHKKYTGVENSLILENLYALDKMGKKIILRCPIIPGINDRKEHFEGIVRVANDLKNVIEINIEAYHPLGKSKSVLLDRKYIMQDIGFTDDETAKKWVNELQSLTNKSVH